MSEKCNAASITQDMQEDAPQEDKFKDTNEITLLQGFSVSVIFSTSLLRNDDKINFQLRFLYYLSLSDEEKKLTCGKKIIGEISCGRGGFNLFIVER